MCDTCWAFRVQSSWEAIVDTITIHTYYWIETHVYSYHISIPLPVKFFLNLILTLNTNKNYSKLSPYFSFEPISEKGHWCMLMSFAWVYSSFKERTRELQNKKSCSHSDSNHQPSTYESNNCPICTRADSIDKLKVYFISPVLALPISRGICRRFFCLVL